MLAFLQIMLLLCNMKVPKMPLTPCVMGIINVTPDSFYEPSRVQQETALRRRVRQIVDEGGAIVDVGACSTRPGAEPVAADQEMERLRWALPVVTDEIGRMACEAKPLVSVDTYRADVAERCVTELGADIINDISGGVLDAGMLDVVARTGAAYVLTHSGGTTVNMSQPESGYPEGVVREVLRHFEQQLEQLERRDVGPDRVMLDPGFGFGKTLEQNYELLRGLEQLRRALPEYRMLVGVSRKRMVWQLLGTDAQHALNGTTVLHTYALLHGASILRVHDVKEAAEAIKICGTLV